MASNGTSSIGRDELPPSCQYILHVLEEEGPLTRTAIVDETALSETTVEWALRRLKNHGFIIAARDPDDLRRNEYNIRGDADL